MSKKRVKEAYFIIEGKDNSVSTLVFEAGDKKKASDLHEHGIYCKFCLMNH